MARQRRRKRGRRRRSEAAELAGRVHEQQGLDRTVDNALRYQECKQKYQEYAKEVHTREQELLSRTLYVSNVKNLHEGRNLELLRLFFQQTYGPVEFCGLATHFGKTASTSRRDRFPKARVRFKHAASAEIIFDGKKLAHVQRDLDPCKIISNGSVGHKGVLRVQPSTRYPGMDVLAVDNSIRFSGHRLLIGHWSPPETFLVAGADLERTHHHGENLFLFEDILNSRVECSINVMSRAVEVRLKREDAMLSFGFKNLQDAMRVFRDEDSDYCLVFRLKYPPRLYQISRRLDRYEFEEEIKERCHEIGGILNEAFASCFAYMIQLSRLDAASLFEDRRKSQKLIQFGVLTREDLFRLHDAEHISSRSVGNEKAGVCSLLCSIKDRHIALILRSLLDNGRFDWYHALHDRASTPDGEKNIFELAEYIPRVQSLSILEKLAGESWPTGYPAKSFQAFVPLVTDESGDEDDESTTPSYCTRTPRLLLTPTRAAITGFSVEMSNRVVRYFVSNEAFQPESFLRVTIGEENGASLFSDELSMIVQSRIQLLLIKGISIDGRNYRFLAYSSSQLKESSLWMVDPAGTWNVEAMRRWMGDFSTCGPPSKVAARKGQCFSTTVVGSDARQEDLHLVPMDDYPDIISMYKGKETCHSDGTGIIELTVFETLLDRLPIGPSDHCDASMIQVRYGGAKGTLTAWNLSKLGLPPHRHRGTNVYLRPSMVKFKCSYRQLEVISVGRHVPYYLNRNVILLLGVHGIRERVLLQMQRKMLNDLDAILNDPVKALHMLPRLGGPDSSLCCLLIHMLSCGMSPLLEPFLFSCIHAVRAFHLTSLRKKSRVFVEQGAVLLGGLDETGQLPEGCVFIQVRPDGSSSDRNAGDDAYVFKILTGPVMVTKHPVMHPGDVRMLLAVDIPELRAHRNCVLFSQLGDRPEADKMVGSDLDGDQFAVTWDNRLFLGEWNGCSPTKARTWRSIAGNTLMMRSSTVRDDAQTLQLANRDPMDFNTDPTSSDDSRVPLRSDDELIALVIKSLSSAHASNAEDSMSDSALIGHFINHAMNDNLGRIATLWLDYANLKSADCNECVRLAVLHSIAVDFPKSGKPATIPPELNIPRNIPRAHWREKKGSPIYHCTGMIGKMYDEVASKMRDQSISETHALPLAGRRFDRSGQILRLAQPSSASTLLEKIYDPTIAIRLGLNIEVAASPGADGNLLLSFIGEALDHREEYETELLRLMSKYDVQCEGELLTGCIRKYHKLDKKRQHDLAETVRLQCRELRNKQRVTFFSFILDTACPILFKEKVVEVEEKTLWIKCIEAAVTGKDMLPEGPCFSAEQIDDFVVLSRKLAASYYEATYNPEIRWEETDQARSSILFSFPWIVADVISAGLRDSA